MKKNAGIAIRGAAEGPLKEVDLDLEYNRLHCFTGRSGSGARTLAIDVLLAESRRRYMLSLAPTERARLGGLGQVKVQSLDGIPPAQFIGGKGSATTVGAYLQLEDPFFALVQSRGTLACRQCGGLCYGYTVNEAVQAIQRRFPQRRLLLSGTLALEGADKSQAVVNELVRAGYRRLWNNGRIVRLDEPEATADVGDRLEVVVDRIAVTQDNAGRLLEALENARALGRGRSRVFTEDDSEGGVFNHQPTCEACGTQTERLPPGRAPDQWQWQGQTLEQWSARSLDDVLKGLDASPEGRRIHARCEWAQKLGLADLAWGQETGALSSGQLRRLQLAAALNQGLVGVLFVVDAPTLALVGPELEAAVQALEELVRRGNTVIVLDHALRQRADRAVHFVEGRCSEEEGADPEAETPPQQRRRALRRRIRIEDGVRQAEIPLDGLVALYGVSGSGKTVLWERWVARLIEGGAKEAVAPVALDPRHGIRRVHRLGAETEGQKDRSIAEVLGVEQPVARLFAATPAAVKRKLAAEFFRLKGPGGRCPVCDGKGRLRRRLYFLEDVDQGCPQCEGKRFRDEVLEITVRGRTISDVLQMEIEAGWEFFRREKTVAAKLERAREGGLGNCRLGQEQTDLEPFQRLMLQMAVGAGRWGREDLVFADNPGAGLHPADVSLLVDRLQALVEDGVSVWVADRDPMLLRQADWAVEVQSQEAGRLPRLGYQGPWRDE